MRYYFSTILLLCMYNLAFAQANFKETVLQLHNTHRAAVHVSPLVWDDELAKSAQEYASYLAKTNKFEHSNKKNIGENLWKGTKNYFSLDYMITDWANEKKYFINKACPNFSTTGNFADVGHYTQMVWSTTEKVGCALVAGKTDEVLVCHYKKQGNIIGVKAY